MRPCSEPQRTPRRLDGRMVLVTGAGSGIGAASVRRLVAEGASVAALDIRAESAAETVASAAVVAGRRREDGGPRCRRG